MGFYVFLPGPGEGPGSPGGPPEPSVGLLGAPGDLPEAPGPKINQSKKPRNLKELTKQSDTAADMTARCAFKIDPET